MRISQEQLQALASAIVDELVRADAMEMAGGRAGAENEIVAEFQAYFSSLTALEREAEKLADRHLQAAGRDAIGLDRRRIVEGIKKKLAEEKGFPA